MNSDERGWCICQLVPGALYEGSWTDGTAIWMDERPIPPEAEINQEYIRWQMEIGREECRVAAKATYEAACAAGYTHTDGHIYRCDKDGVLDFALAYILYSVDPYEPVYVMDIEDTVVEMAGSAYLVLCKAVGTYHMQLRMAYWQELNACEV